MPTSTYFGYCQLKIPLIYQYIFIGISPYYIAKLFQVATFHGYHHYIYLPAVNLPKLFMAQNEPVNLIGKQ